VQRSARTPSCPCSSDNTSPHPLPPLQTVIRKGAWYYFMRDGKEEKLAQVRASARAGAHTGALCLSKRCSKHRK